MRRTAFAAEAAPGCQAYGIRQTIRRHAIYAQAYADAAPFIVCSRSSGSVERPPVSAHPRVSKKMPPSLAALRRRRLINASFLVLPANARLSCLPAPSAACQRMSSESRELQVIACVATTHVLPMVARIVFSSKSAGWWGMQQRHAQHAMAHAGFTEPCGRTRWYRRRRRHKGRQANRIAR